MPKVKISRKYSTARCIVLEPGEHEVDAEEVKRMEAFGVIEKPDPKKPEARKPPKNRANKSAPNTK